MEKATDKHFRALFDGDEVNGKFYPLDAPMTGLDAPTAAYLTGAGRIIEITAEQAAELAKEQKLKSSGKRPRQTEGSETEIDADLMKDGKILENAELVKIATAEGIDLKKTTKDEMVAEIMSARSAKA